MQFFRNVAFWLGCLWSPATARKHLLAYLGMLCRKYIDAGWENGTEFVLFETLTTGKVGRYEITRAERRRLKAFYLLGRKYWWHFPDHVAEPYAVHPDDWAVIPAPEGFDPTAGENGRPEFRAPVIRIH